jgi:hypothetical protein
MDLNQDAMAYFTSRFSTTFVAVWINLRHLCTRDLSLMLVSLMESGMHHTHEKFVTPALLDYIPSLA